MRLAGTDTGANSGFAIWLARIKEVGSCALGLPGRASAAAMKRVFLELICIFALLVAQQAALTHSIWHFRDFLPAHEQQGDARAAPHSYDRNESPQSTLCGQHGALAALLAGSCLAQPRALSTGGSHWLITAAAAWRVAQRTSTPPSRAPPVLL